MSRNLSLLLIVLINSCALLSGGSVPVRNAEKGSAFCVKIVSDFSIQDLYFKSHNSLIRAEKFGSYYIIFNIPPGQYDLSHGERMYDRYEFDGELKKLCSVVIGEKNFKFVGSFSIQAQSSTYTSTWKRDLMIMNTPRSEQRYYTYYFGAPVIHERSAAYEEFRLAMKERFKDSGWDLLLEKEGQ